MRRALAGVGALLALGAAPSIASAQQVPSLVTSSGSLDTVVLRTGVVLRGVVEEIQPGARIHLVLPDGASRDIAWAEVATVSGPAFSPPGPPASTSVHIELLAPTPPPAAPVPSVLPADDLSTVPEPDRVPVTVESSGQALDVAAVTDAPDVARCTTPCTLYALPGRAVRVRTTSALHDVFRYADPVTARRQPTAIASVHEILAPWTGGLRVKVRPPSMAATVTGAMIGLLGSAGIMAGGMLVLMGSIGSGITREQLDTAAVGSATVGGSLLATGIGVALSGASTIESTTRTDGRGQTLRLIGSASATPTGVSVGATLRF